ncbi:MAG: methyltransferase [Lentisphaerae bacterium]|nr:methyltransferase [Lentisphaerota bacterium]MCP4103159.1 methyltransferase [Lentisphaerota bacterium]
MNAIEEMVSKAQEMYLKRIREKKEKYRIQYLNYSLIAYPNVYPPYIDNELVIKNVKISENDVVLDLCAGVGLLTVFAAQTAKRVVATDINPAAIESIKENALLCNVQDKVTAVCCCDYPDPPEQYDKILLIPPLSDKKAEDILEKSLFDEGHKAVIDIIAGAVGHLKPNGELYIRWSDIGDMSFIYNLLQKYGFKYQSLAKTNDALSTFVLFKATL